MVDPWLSLAQRRDTQLVELEQHLEAVTTAALAETLAQMWSHVLGERVALVAATQPPNSDGLEQLAERAWKAALDRWVRPVVEAGYRRQYGESTLGDREPPAAVVDRWWQALAARLGEVIQSVVSAVRATLSSFAREPVDRLRDRVARVLQLDAYTATIRDQIAEIELELLDPGQSRVDQGAVFARRVRLQTVLFLLRASRARSDGFQALAAVAPESQRLELRAAARSAARPMSAVRDAERDLRRLDDSLYRNPTLDPERLARLRARLQELNGQGRSHETWHELARREARGEATAILNAATLQRGLDEAERTGQEYVKRWFATLTDQRTRPTHRDANGQVVGILEPFQVGDASLDHPGDITAPPEERVNCRCSMAVLTRADHDEIAASLQAAATIQEDNVTATAVEPGASAVADLPIGWRGILAPLETRTGDGRYLRVPAAGVRFRQEPLPIAWQPEIADGHDGGVVVSRIAKHWVENNANGTPMLWGQGPFDLGKPEGIDAARELHVGNANGISVDLDDVTVTWDDETETAFFDDWRVMGATMVPHPAFDEARIRPVYADDLDLTLVASLMAAEPLQAGPMAGEHVYPAGWFEDPQFTEYTPLTITSEGRVFGHVADRSVCHIGIGDICVYAPRSPSGYAFFHVGECITDAGPLAIGRLTVGGGHADERLGYRAATAHYDDSAFSVAYVRAYDDGIGVAVAGAIIDGTPPEKVSELRAHPPSGDWRPIGGNLEMIGALGVVVPGFPGPRTQAVIAGGQVRTIIAAGWRPPPSIEDTVRAEVVATMRRIEKAKQLAARMQPTQEFLKSRAAALAVRVSPSNQEG